MKLPRKLDRLQELVSSFYRVTASIDLHEVLRSTLDSATRLMNAKAGSIALVDDDGRHLRFVETSSREKDDLKGLRIPLGEGICGHVAESGRTVRVVDAKQDPRFYAGIDKKLGNETRTYLCTPLIIDGKPIGTAQVLNRLDGQGFTADDELLLEGFARQAALAIQNARLHELEMKQQAIEAELSVCASIQQNLFPKRRPSLPGFEVYAASRPCREVGGDYYTFINRAGGQYDVAIADVSGKGLSAAMIVSDLHTGLHLLSGLESDLGSALTSLNRHLQQSLLANKFITLVIARLDPASARLDYVVAGHTPPVVIRGTGEVTALQVTGPVLGVLDCELTQRSIELAPGDLLVSYTDGYSEAESPDGVQLGDEEITRALVQWRDLPLEEIASRLDRKTEEHRHGQPSHDDLTLLLVRRQAEHE